MTIELSIDRIDGTRAARGVLFLHGILGRGANLRTTARQFVEQRPEWSAWLVDLRGHGRSPKGTPDPSLEAAAKDVVAVALRQPMPIGAIIGHSFGGKVALEVTRLDEDASLAHAVVIDSMPGKREPVRGSDSALAVVETLESLPTTFASITEFVRAVEAAGFARELAQWLAGSLEREGNQVRFALDLREIRSMLLDYFARELWPVVENPPDAVRVHLVIGSRSDTYSMADRERAHRIAASNDRVTVDLLPAGHWVHVDDPDGLLRILAERLSD